MLVKFYIAVGLFLCIGLGIGLAAGWKTPSFGGSSGGSGYYGVRGGGVYSSGGWGFGK